MKRIWMWPLVLNAAIVAGLALALVIETRVALAFAWLLLALPLVVIVGAMVRPRRTE